MRCTCRNCQPPKLTRAQEDALRDLVRLADQGEIRSPAALCRQVRAEGNYRMLDVVTAYRAWKRPLNWD